MKRLIHTSFLILSLICLYSCGTDPSIIINDSTNYIFTAQGGTQNLTFTCNRDWFISSSESWCSVSPSSGLAQEGPISITISCESNPNYDSRSCVLSLNIDGANKTIQIEQETAIGLLVSPTTFDLTSIAQSIEIEVQSNVEYIVSVAPECEHWIARTKDLSSSKLSFNIADNIEYDARDGFITIAQKDGNLSSTIKIHQAQTDGLMVTATQYEVSEEEQSINVEVKANVEFDVLSETEWIKYVKTKALQTSEIILTVEANNSTFNRSGAITIKQKDGSLTQTIAVLQQAKPKLNTESSSDISLFSATLNGSLAVESAAAVTDDVWFLYSSSAQTIDELKAKGNKVISQLDDSGSFSKQLTGLSLATPYYYVACALVNGREYYGDVNTFTTLDYSAEVETGMASMVDFFSCNLRGQLSTTNADSFTKDVWFLYSSTSSTIDELLANGIRVSSSLSEEGVFTATLEGLEHGTTYQYIACAKVHDRDYYGIVKSFTTKGFSADVSTVGATSDRLYMATLSGSVALINASNFTKSAGFLYGENLTSLEQLIANGNSMTALIDLDSHFSGELNGLKCGVTYFFVAWVKVFDSTFYGEVLSFTSYALPEGAVDMGLSVAWASCNIDALSPEEIGGLYAWGEIETKTTYDWRNYLWGTPSNLTKYNTDRYVGIVDNILLLEPDDDVAHVKLGGRWRIPTKEEYEELISNCSWSWMKYHGVLGCMITSNINGNKIFIPATSQTRGDYWTASYHLRELATILWIEESFMTVGYGSYRCQGLPIRPVTE